MNIEEPQEPQEPQANTLPSSTTDRLASRRRYQAAPGSYLNWKRLPQQILQMAHEVGEAGPQCLTTFCTNLRAAQLAPALEAALGIPVYDTVSTAVKSLRLCGVDTRRVTGWGSLFDQEIA